VVSEWSSPSLSLLFQLPNCARPLLLTMTPSTSAYARLATSLKRALGPAGADGRLATDAAAAARRLAGVGAVRDPPAGGGGGGEGAASTSTTTPAGRPLPPLPPWPGTGPGWWTRCGCTRCVRAVKNVER